MIKSKHKLGNCAHCGQMVYCWKCGNNTCNGGHGEVDGKECDVCPDAYEMASKYSSDYKSVVFANSHEFIEVADDQIKEFSNRTDLSKKDRKWVDEWLSDIEERNAYNRTLPIV